MRSLLLCLPVLVVAALAGCARADYRLDDDAEVRALAPRATTATAAAPRLRLGVAPIAMTYALERAPEDEPNRVAVAVDAAALRETLCDALRRFTPFQDVVPLDPAPGDGGVFAAAHAAGADVVLSVRLDGFHDIFRGRNGYFIPNMFLWYYLWVPSWFIRDETFGADVDALLVFSDARSEATLLERRVKLETERKLDDFDRGWDFLGLFRFPGSIDEEQWKKVADRVNPEAGQLLARETIMAAALEAAPLATPGIRRPTTFAVVAGVPAYRSPAIAGTPASKRDVEAVGDLLADAGVPAKNVRRIVGEQATREGIEDAIADAAGRAAEDDTVLVYFSGAGATGGDGERALLGHDADPQAAAHTGVRLARIRELLGRGRARRAILIADAAFDGPRGLRSFGAEPLTAGRPAAPAALDLAILTAASGRESAGDIDGAGTGLLTFALVDGATGPADTDGDGFLTLEELAAHAARFVDAQAQLEGRRQRPAFAAPAAPEGAPVPWSGHSAGRKPRWRA